MRRLLTITMMTIALVLNAKVYNANTLPVNMDRLNYSRVINPDAILSQETVNAIDTLLFQLQTKTGVQAMIIAITNIENDDPFQFTFDVFNKYGVGSKETNTGFVLTLATQDRSYQIITGKGLEGTLPDAICKRIENRVMLPELRKEDWDMAILNTVMAIKEYIEGDETIKQAYAEDGEDGSEDLFAFLAAMVFLSIFTVPIYLSYKEKLCKVCKKHSMQRVSREVIEVKRSSKKIRELWRCKNCGHQEYRTHTEHTGGGGGGGFYPGGSFGHSRSSGGFGGFGGFGGGRSAGGGAGGRF